MTFTDLNASNYLELAKSLAQQIARLDGFQVIGIAGAQGTGKTTFAGRLSSELVSTHAESVAVLSLDDFYLPRHERLILAEQVHPLLSTRGVPGTHDARLMASVIERLRSGESVEAPVFDKAIDDRAAQSQSIGPARILLVEGWCWGARPESQARLSEPVNFLEATQDHDGGWRAWVNEKLADYQALFVNDALLYLRAPSFDAILAWRWQQEQELARSHSGDQIMTREEIAEFIARYERITTWMLEELPDRADITVALDASHGIEHIVSR
ncbi:MAG: hypothetical protein JJ934_05725 [Pseudomonadales bacterium]|nr:hypothetical protein [Pseudomonadales bacterium]